MIEKTIHYCWFGGNPLPKLAKKCIASWQKYCPDYKIIQWDETNFDINCNEWCREMYKQKKWAFLSDYAMLRLISNPDEIKKEVKDKAGYNRYYPIGYKFYGNIYAFTSQLYGYKD